jgi:curved DNA-binding protein CbpA
MIDHYEFLQISPNADSETIHRVYRFLATRLHPDNPDSGDGELFCLLKKAYDVLSHPDRRAEYDARRRNQPFEPVPFSTEVDFMDNLEGELNRRLAVLAVLYYRRRTNPHMPEVPLADIEQRMGFPRDYLDFTTWYLVKKGYITRADNAQFTLTAEGVDFVETERAHVPVLNKMLAGTSATASLDAAGSARRPVPVSEPILLSSGTRRSLDRPAEARNGTALVRDRRPAGSHSAADMIDLGTSPDRRSRAKGRRSED